MTARRKSNWTKNRCLSILSKHWDDETAILNVLALTEEVGGTDAAASLFTDTLSFGLRIWERHAADALRNIIIGHLLPQKEWLRSLWNYSETMIDTDPDEFVRLYTLISAGQSDFVRAWMAKPLVTLLQSGSESRRMLGFQGVECLIKSGAAESVKRCQPVLREIAIGASDTRDKAAATELITMLQPAPSSSVRLTQEKSSTLSRILPILPGLKSSLPSTGTVTRAYLQNSLQKAMERILSEVGGNDGLIDLIATEIEFPSFFADSPNGSQPVRVMVGRLSSLFQQDLYEHDKVYPFVMEWRSDAPLLIQIFGTVPYDFLEQNRVPGAFTVTLEAIHQAKSSCNDLVRQANELLVLCPSSFGNAEDRRAAAKVAIQSTRYTQDLMDPSFAEQHQGEFQKAVKADPLPHLDQRNLLFLPLWVGGVCVGGTAVYSHHRLDRDTRLLLEMYNVCMLSWLGVAASVTSHHPA